MKTDLIEMYQQGLMKLVEAKECMKDFMDGVEFLDENVEGANNLKETTRKFKRHLYDEIERFLDDYSMLICSSQIATAIEELADDEEENEEDED